MHRIFDPASETRKLHDHLVSHDKPIVAVTGCADARGTLYEDAWEAIVAALQADRRTIEDILSFVSLRREAVIGDDKLAGLRADELKTLEETIQQAISRDEETS